MMVWSWLECEVKWALGSITTNKASGGDGIPVELFPKRWCCESATLNMPANLENSAATTGLEKVIFIPIPKKGNAKEFSSYCTIALISHASKVMLKISKPGFSNTWTVNFQMFKLDLEKAEKPEIKLPTSIGSSKKQKSSRKTSISALLTMPKPLTVWITINCGKFFKRWVNKTTWLALEKPICRLGSNS